MSDWPPARSYKIGPLTLEPHRQLLAGDVSIHLGGKALELLSLLAESDGHLVTKDEIMAGIWPNATVEENAIQVHVNHVRKALGDHADRIQTVRGIGYRLVPDHGHGDGLPAPARAVAVLPFVNFTGEPDFACLCDSFAEELNNRLSRSSGLLVPARTSTYAHGRCDGDVRQIASELGVGSIVEGSLRKSDVMLRITAQLIDGRTGFHIWSQTFDRELSDPLAVEDDVAGAVADTIVAILVPERDQG